jgi:DNA-binding LacI/PurR family transcriptional regulator
MNVHGPRVNIRDVARRAAVSSGTVSRVLNEHPNIDEELRRRVLRAVSELGYVPRRERGRPSPRPAAARTIGFFLIQERRARDLLGSFWAPILEGAEREARRRGARIAYRPVHPDEVADLDGHIERSGLDAALLVGVTPVASVRDVLRAGRPACLVDNAVPGLSVDAVLSDNFGGAAMAVDHLLQHGHRQIAFIGGPLEPGPVPVSSIYTLEWRAIGYRTALRRAGLAVVDELVESCDLTPAGGHQACRRLLASGRPLTSIFCGNDPCAMGALQALREAGLDVPGQVSVVGFDDDLADHMVPPLTTIHVDKQGMGSAAARRLLDRITDPDGPPLTITLPVSLVERASVRRR